MKNKVDGKTITVKESFTKAFSRWGYALITTFVVGLYLVGLTLLLIIPGIIFSVYWTFILQSVVLKDKSLHDAIRDSKEVVINRWWTVFWYNIGIFFVGFMLTVPVFLSLDLIFYTLIDNFFLNVLISSFINLISAYFIVLYSVFYINFEATKRGAVIEKK